MTRLVVLALVVLAAPAAGQDRATREAAEAASAVERRCARLLSPDLVATAAGRGPVRVAPFDPRLGAGGVCNYAAGGDTVLLTLDIDRIAHVEKRFRRLRTGPFARENQSAAAVGDEAFTHGAFGEHLVARRGQLLLRMTATVVTDPRAVRAVGPVVSRDELIALARRVFTPP
jgi:hypothetical protein